MKELDLDQELHAGVTAKMFLFGVGVGLVVLLLSLPDQSWVWVGISGAWTLLVIWARFETVRKIRNGELDDEGFRKLPHA